ncbi:ribonuclease H-like domain-containing protein [Tanacetum coccineum]
MSTHLMITCAKAGIFKSLERMNCHVTTTSSLPRSHVHALRDPNWKEVMLDEYNALITNGTWVLVSRPANINVVRSMWIFKHKFNADGSSNRYKASLVVNGRSQQQGSDIAYLLLYVDDIILTTSFSAFLQRIISSLHEEILEQAHMQNCNPCRTLVDTESKLGLDGDPGLILTANTDADWAGCHVTRRSTSEYFVFLGDNLLSWSAKRQVTLSRSSVEAEYRGVATVVAETPWIRNLLRELHTPLFTATLVYWDIVSAVYMSANPVQHQHTKHIEIDIHFIRDFVASGSCSSCPFAISICGYFY